MIETIRHLMTDSIVAILIGVGILFLASKLLNGMFKIKYNILDEVNESVISISIRNASIYIGISLAMIGVVESPLWQLIDGLTAIVFMYVSTIISDKVLFPKIDNSFDIGKGNISLSLAEAGLFIGTGLIAQASFTGEGPWISSIVFFMYGQLILIGAVFVAEKMYKNIVQNIERYRISSGILLGSIVLSFSMIISTALAGDFSGWLNDLADVTVYAVFGFILLFLFANKFIDYIYLPKTTISEELENDNIAAIVIVSGMKIAIAMFIAGVIS